MGLDELERYYPFKTRDAQMRELRQKLLPILCKHLVDSKERQFGFADNEIHLLELLPQERRLALEVRWKVLEPQLVQALVAHAGDESRRDGLLYLIARGKELFVRGSRISHGRPFGRLLQEAEEAGTGAAVLPEVRKLYVDALPPSERRRTALKSQLFALVEFGGRGSSSLKEEAKQLLLEKAPSIVKKLPGHIESPRRGWLHQEMTFSPLLDRLVGRDVLGPFEFLTLAG